MGQLRELDLGQEGLQIIGQICTQLSTRGQLPKASVGQNVCSGFRNIIQKHPTNFSQPNTLMTSYMSIFLKRMKGILRELNLEAVIFTLSQLIHIPLKMSQKTSPCLQFNHLHALIHIHNKLIHFVCIL